jgi:hypothetical protein
MYMTPGLRPHQKKIVGKLPDKQQASQTHSESKRPPGKGDGDPDGRECGQDQEGVFVTVS